MNIISVNNLEKKYDSGVYAVRDISFEVEEGSFFALLGPNGAGKTTTQSVLTTNLSKTNGTVEIAGLDLDKHEGDIRTKIGVIFQKQSLDDTLSAEENIRLHANVYGLYPFRPAYRLMSPGYKKRLMELSEILGMQNAINRQAGTLSGGMKRRFEIIRGLMHKPKILFLDEPSTGIDAQSRRDLWDYLKQVQREEGLTVFFTTHYMDEAEYADNICIMTNGEIVKKGSPQAIRDELLEEYLVSRVDEGNGKSFESELHQQKLSFEKINKETYKINIEGRDPQKVIKSIETPMNYLDIERPSLEDAYVEVTKNQI